ncbi:methyl-accepting chemotaxis protein [Vibrio sp. JC009]|uniref:methyl-accepting chemotaxis protein n=1 Tax=Vibrio sp. JC009 TaxID=2912314 RepID=UPI0023AF8989|nr:methyl-accepting chemotaxis protein [Vibrio sp. JC009]WED23987.1 methyl-accepting chemotaxis protein [Vibrio sp. JC009]
MNILFNFKGRIIAAAMTLLVLSMTILSYLSYRQMSELVIDNLDDYSMLELSSSAEEIHSLIEGISQEISLSSHLFTELRDETAIFDYLRQVKALSEATAIVVGYENGVAYNSNHGKYVSRDYDPRMRGWYKSAKSKRKTIITDVYKGKATGALMISIATPFYNGSQLDGVLLADVELAVFNSIIANTLSAGARTTLYDDSGLVIASTYKNDELGVTRISDFSDLAELEREVFSRESGVFEYSFGEMSKVAYFQSIFLDDETEWHLMVSLDKAKAYRVLDDSLYTTVATTVILVSISVLLIYFILTYAYRPVVALKKTVNELSSGNGDLTKRLPVTSKDDLGQISSDINVFIENLQTMMQSILSASDRIAGSIDGLQGLTRENRESLTLHKAETEQAVTALEEMGATSNDVARNTSDAVEHTGKTNAQTSKSKQIVSGATDTVIQLVARVDEASSQINQMGNEIDDITQVLEVIGEIADQTNLLALNAAIEAARAGEQGRGFAVVADEVRALASRTQASTTEIQNTINRLTSSSKSVIESMDATKTSCEEASAQTHLVVEDLDKISSSVDNINNLNVQIATAAEQQNSVASEITKNMVTINEMVERIAASGNDVNNVASSLADANSQLKSVVGQFRL